MHFQLDISELFLISKKSIRYRPMLYQIDIKNSSHFHQTYPIEPVLQNLYCFSQWLCIPFENWLAPTAEFMIRQRLLLSTTACSRAPVLDYPLGFINILSAPFICMTEGRLSTSSWNKGFDKSFYMAKSRTLPDKWWWIHISTAATIPATSLGRRVLDATNLSIRGIFKDMCHHRHRFRRKLRTSTTLVWHWLLVVPAGTIFWSFYPL